MVDYSVYTMVEKWVWTMADLSVDWRDVYLVGWKDGLSAGYLDS